MQIQTIQIIDDIKSFLDEVFDKAISLWASDIHFEPWKDNFFIRYRIDGDLYVLYDISNENTDSIIARIKILARLKSDEKRLPQDGQIVYDYKWEDIDFRVSTFPTLYWEKIVIRILKKDINLLNLDKLWFLTFNLKLIKQALTLKEWLILVAWPTGSWKTTTLYSLLNQFDPKKYNISTLEDPIEYKLPGISQSQINTDIWYDFSEWLRSLLRQDPDIILVWEIRDPKTAQLAIEACLTWHLVLWTIHANKWSWVIERLLNLWVPAYLISNVLKLIISQRLVRKLCSCANKIDIPTDIDNIFQQWLWTIYEEKLKKSNTFKTKVWCEKCLGNWYKLRIWLHEVIYLDDKISSIINEKFSSSKWDKIIKEKWYLTLYQDWLIKTLYWITDIWQILPYKD